MGTVISIVGAQHLWIICFAHKAREHSLQHCSPKLPYLWIKAMYEFNSLFRHVFVQQKVINPTTPIKCVFEILKTVLKHHLVSGKLIDTILSYRKGKLTSSYNSTAFVWAATLHMEEDWLGTTRKRSSLYQTHVYLEALSSEIPGSSPPHLWTGKRLKERNVLLSANSLPA